MSKKELSLGKLEQSLEDLEQLVERLEEGEMPLDQALREFERGVKLTRQCQSVLREAEQKIEILLAESEEPEAFEGAAEDEAASRAEAEAEGEDEAD